MYGLLNAGFCGLPLPAGGGRDTGGGAAYPFSPRAGRRWRQPDEGQLRPIEPGLPR
ncbi:hypothetical protein GOB91_21985 [Sinorhizobium meliloti]|nr:hypothetical protein [Sinorhizobium meliloti]MDW9456476.1 hypothetical protein [Sinorhizobium meliloti]MDW9469252.1 hypothetical protein [Sinorhizobium meliloti]MDW9520200.1 hypothetical protein [Sinorhizobium meliloti]MDW9557568.1 hypothetical protein [Sinorhizobium meliloti]